MSQEFESPIFYNNVGIIFLNNSTKRKTFFYVVILKEN